MNRRTFLATPAALATPAGFRYRGYLGWITDLATGVDPNVKWPSMRLDAGLLKDYHETFAVMKELGLGELCIWGLYVSNAWPVDIRSAVTPERGKLAQRLIDDAHAHGIRVISGLGVYSWGFEEILKANPQLMKGNQRAMCGSEEASWEWMRKVIDFVFERFPIDGVSMQSADQGRCTCDKCKRYTATAYHAMLNIRCADYIRSKWPKKLVAVSGWGMRFEEPDSIPPLVDLSKKIDYLIDVPDSSRRKDPAQRKKLIGELKCAFGTLGGPQVEPPQHWARDRWFLPTVKRSGTHLEELYADGGRACEWFYHIFANPGDELSTWVVAKVLNDPATGWDAHLKNSVDRLYRPSNAGVRDGLCEAFLAAEDAYFRHWKTEHCGTISMEPLVSSESGPPVYLTKRLNAAQRAEYARELEGVSAKFEKLLGSVGGKSKVRLILRCIENSKKDALS